MKKNVKLLDCTLRDGAYIVNSNFGENAIRGIIKKLQDANVEIIECGWLKDSPHVKGSSYYHEPQDLEQYLIEKRNHAIYTVMIDWDRYDVKSLPENNKASVDAIRVVFPYGKHKEGIKVGEVIRKKGYRVFYQAANTLAYDDSDLIELARDMNAAKPAALSLVDTFGAMYEEDLERIAGILDRELDTEIILGFHSHNNQQLSFALSMNFIKMFRESEREIMVDASLNGMGRGAGNTPTELIVNYLNQNNYNYEMDSVMDAIDIYMNHFKENYEWGYSTPYFIAGMYCCHVNNIAYLLKNHRTSAKDLRNIIESLPREDRKKYDYDLLEEKYMENQGRLVEDESVLKELKEVFKNKTLLLIAPGKSAVLEKEKIDEYIQRNQPVVIAVNALLQGYTYDYVFIANRARYDYAKEAYSEQFENTKKILLSNIKVHPAADEYIVNFNRAIKRGWEHFDNSVICCLRLLDKLQAEHVVMAGFDGFRTKYNESYADPTLPTLNPDNRWNELNEEIKSMFRDVKKTAKSMRSVQFLTESLFEEDGE